MTTKILARRSHCNRCDQPYEYDIRGGTQYVCDECLERDARPTYEHINRLPCGCPLDSGCTGYHS